MDCPEFPKCIEDRAVNSAEHKFLSNTLINVSEKIDRLTQNGFSRDKHDAVVDAEHKREMGDKLAKRENGWAHTAIVAACSAGGILLAGKAIPVMFKFLGEVFK